MFADEITIACVKRLETSLFYKLKRADRFIAAMAFVWFIDRVDTVVRPAVFLLHRAHGFQKFMEAADEFRRMVGGFDLQRAHQIAVDGLEGDDGDAREADLAVKLHEMAETGHVDMEILSVVSDFSTVEWIHHEGVHAMFAEHSHLTEDFIIGEILIDPALSICIEAERHVMVFGEGEIIDRQNVCGDRFAIDENRGGVNAWLGVRWDGCADAEKCGHVREKQWIWRFMEAFGGGDERGGAPIRPLR